MCRRRHCPEKREKTHGISDAVQCLKAKNLHEASFLSERIAADLDRDPEA